MASAIVFRGAPMRSRSAARRRDMKNPALSQLDDLIGDWDLTMTGAWFLDSVGAVGVERR